MFSNFSLVDKCMKQNLRFCELFSIMVALLILFNWFLVLTSRVFVFLFAIDCVFLYCNLLHCKYIVNSCIIQGNYLSGAQNKHFQI